MNGDANLMGVEIVGINKAHIVSGDNRQTFLFRKGNGGMQIPLFVSTSGADEFQVKPIGKVLLIKAQALINQRHIAT